MKPITTGPAQSPFEFRGGNPCLDFANTVDDRTSAHPHELLTNYERLLQWGAEAGVITGRTVARLRHLGAERPSHTLTVLRQGIQLRDAIYGVFSGVAHRQAIPATALGTLNDAVRHAAGHTQLVHGNRLFTSEWVEPERHLDSLLWPVSRAAAELLVSEGIGQVRQCASDSCSWLFLDESKNHKRRWCDMKVCGNRDKARRYYQRKKAG